MTQYWAISDKNSATDINKKSLLVIIAWREYQEHCGQRGNMYNRNHCDGKNWSWQKYNFLAILSQIDHSILECKLDHLHEEIHINLEHTGNHNYKTHITAIFYFKMLMKKITN